MAAVHVAHRPALPIHVLHGVPLTELHVAEISFYSGDWVASCGWIKFHVCLAGVSKCSTVAGCFAEIKHVRARILSTHPTLSGTGCCVRRFAVTDQSAVCCRCVGFFFVIAGGAVRGDSGSARLVVLHQRAHGIPGGVLWLP